ncbi:MAG: exodeoxyribonuclease VII large subunit [Alphaproteobacteria bacterium]|nr:exodeoxyribonuclease VII large subunit [Alphaproteobacteria bacterium]
MPRKPTQPPLDIYQPELLDAPRPGSNLPEFSVTDISRQLKRTVEENFSLVRVRGEVGDCKYHSSGHLYFSLKDDNAVLSAVCWRGQVGKLGLRPEVGMEVVCTGRITTYAGQSKYQLVVESMAMAGVGALLKMLEERRRKLAAEGLFNADRKKALPFLPNVIGVITSPTGAVIRDILHRLSDRFPRRVIVWPVAVQGEGAAAQIADAINGFNNFAKGGEFPRPDIIIVARGGGSVEDLMPFNEEIVVRAAASSSIPLISAVGHETDTTLIDYASDVRAPTPTAAAEMAVPVRADLLSKTLTLGARIEAAASRMIKEKSERLVMLNRSLGDPARAIEPLVQRLDERSERLVMAWKNYLKHRLGGVVEASGKLRHPRDVLQLAGQRLMNCSQKLDANMKERLLHMERRLEKLTAMLGVLSPRAVLGRGYALIYDSKGHLVTEAAKLKRQDAIKLELQDGSRVAVISD